MLQKKIIDLCNTLYIPPQNIHIRSRKDEDVKIYLKPMDIYKIGVDMSDLMEEAYLSITQVLEDKLLYLAHLSFLSQDIKPLYKHVIRKDLVKLNLELLEIIKGDGDKTGVYSGISVNAQALKLHHMLELIEQQGLEMLMEYMKKMRKDSRKKSSSKAIKILANNPQLRRVYIELKKNEEFSPKELIHPKLPVLKKCLIEELNKNKQAKILVFVKLRNSVKNIVNKLDKIDLIRPVRFVGQTTKSKEDKGLSQKRQVEILELFKEGKYNVLVATNVAEEGLDIAECDLVIFYDVVASEIRLIQRKGRTARHRKGKVLILYTKNTRDDIYMKIALKKLKKMNVNLKNKQQLHGYYAREQIKKDVLLNQESLNNHTQARNNDGLPQNNEVKFEIVRPKMIIPKNKKFNLDYFAEKALEEKEKQFKEKSPGIIISKDLPLKYGLRHELKTRSIPFIAISSEVHVVINDKILVQVYKTTPQNFLMKKYLSLYERYRRKYELVIFVFELLDFQESFGGEKRLFKRKVQELTMGNDLQVVPIDDHSELFFLVRSLYEQKNSR
ncbi:MAG: helicase-related protein [Promethearchaeota archaeon]